MEENINTGVIYKITNTINNKQYIGKTYSYIKNGNNNYKYGALGRFKRHLSNAFSSNEKTKNECPELYKDIRSYGKDNFNVITLVICNKNDLKNKEKEQIKLYETYKKEKGYNILIGNNKPEDPTHLLHYKNNKILNNKLRCVNSSMKYTLEGKELPPNINYRIKKDANDKIISEGYFVQIKINNKLYNKAFLSMKLSLEDKLILAKEQLVIFKNIPVENI